MGIIYCVQNKIDGKRYIGQTRHSLEEKRRAYEARARRGRGAPFLLVDALREHGKDAFEWTIIFDDLDDEDLDEYEIDAIAVHRTLAPNGYNRMSGGRKGGCHSEETREKMSEAASNMSEGHRKRLGRRSVRLRSSESRLQKRPVRRGVRLRQGFGRREDDSPSHGFGE